MQALPGGLAGCNRTGGNLQGRALALAIEVVHGGQRGKHLEHVWAVVWLVSERVAFQV
jgi:hypothetical protein